jgi:hypothetical protein
MYFNWHFDIKFQDFFLPAGKGFFLKLTLYSAVLSLLWCPYFVTFSAFSSEILQRLNTSYSKRRTIALCRKWEIELSENVFLGIKGNYILLKQKEKLYSNSNSSMFWEEEIYQRYWEKKPHADTWWIAAQRSVWGVHHQMIFGRRKHVS